MTNLTSPTAADAISTDTDNVTENSEQATRWRDVLRVHPAAELFPLMSETELHELAEDVKKNGLREPVTVWCERKNGIGTYWLVDGRNRLDALELIDGLRIERGSAFPESSRKKEIRSVCNVLYREKDFDPFAYVISANLRRRHLTADQRRELIAKVLKAKPEASNRQIAKQVKADDKTVAKVRTKLEATADIPQLTKTTGKDGKTRRKRRTPLPKPMTADRFMERAFPSFELICDALAKVAASDPAGARHCAEKMKAAIDAAIEDSEAACDDHPAVLQ